MHTDYKILNISIIGLTVICIVKKSNPYSIIETYHLLLIEDSE